MQFIFCSADGDTGAFYEFDDRHCCGWFKDPSMEELIEAEIITVQDIALRKIKKLRGAPDIHIGLECFHLFVLDLLGVSNTIFNAHVKS